MSMRRASSSSDEVDRSGGSEKDDVDSVSIRQGGAAARDVEKGLPDDMREVSGKGDAERAEIEPAVEEGDAALEQAPTTREKAVDGLARVLSRVISRASTVDAGPPPDGGAKAWITGKFVCVLALLSKPRT